MQQYLLYVDCIYLKIELNKKSAHIKYERSLNTVFPWRAKYFEEDYQQEEYPFWDHASKSKTWVRNNTTTLNDKRAM